MGYKQLSCLERLAARLPPGVLAYKSPKFIKVDVPAVAVLHRCLQLLVFLLALVQLYFNDAWALAEVPSGTSNGWGEVGTMLKTTNDPLLISKTQYCFNDTHSYSEGTYNFERPQCEALLPGELTVKTPNSIFFTTAVFETTTHGWPCAADAATGGTRRIACSADGGSPYDRSNGQCGCVSTRAIYPLAVEEMIMNFEHSYDTDLLGLYGNSVDSTGFWSDAIFANGTRKRFEAGEVLSMPVSEWLTAANLSLDDTNDAVRRDVLGRAPRKRTTGVTVRVQVEYTNQDLNVKRAVPGKKTVHAFVRSKAEHGTWTSGGAWVSWHNEPKLPRTVPQEYHLVERSRQGVLFLFSTTGLIFKFDPWVALGIFISSLVLLQLANLITDAVAFYLLPGGQSTILRNKRQELVSKKSEFAELGMKAALAASNYRQFDPDNNGSIDPVDIVKVFAHVEDVTWEQAHSIAYMILEDADTDDGKEGGQFGLSFHEFMTCLEGDAINFKAFLKNLEPNLAAVDRSECQMAFEEERAKLPAPVRGSQIPPQAAQPVKLELTEEQRKARLQREGVLRIHVKSASGLKPADKNGKADPFCVVAVGKKERRSKTIHKTLEPVWDDGLMFKPATLDKVCKRGMKLEVRDADALRDETIGTLNVKLDVLQEHSSFPFAEQLQPQGAIEFVVIWEESIPQATSTTTQAQPLPAPASAAVAAGSPVKLDDPASPTKSEGSPKPKSGKKSMKKGTSSTAPRADAKLADAGDESTTAATKDTTQTL